MSAERSAFRAAVGRGETFDLGLAALLVAEGVYPDFTPQPGLAELDRLAGEVSDRVGPGATARQRIRAMQAVLFGSVGHSEPFRGDPGAWGDPENSYLHRVLERRRGLPVTLSVLYMEIGRRIGLEVTGVPFPGHFLVRVALEEGVAVVDPCFGAKTLGVPDLLRRIARFVEDPEEARVRLERVLEGTTPRFVLARVLRNLERALLEREDFAGALQAVDKRVVLTPDDPDARLTRGDLFFRLEAGAAALEDYRAYLRIAPRGPAAERVRQFAAALAARPNHLN